MRNASSYDLMRASAWRRRDTRRRQPLSRSEQLELGLLLLAENALAGPAEGERVRRIGGERTPSCSGPR